MGGVADEGPAEPMASVSNLFSRRVSVSRMCTKVLSFLKTGVNNHSNVLRIDLGHSLCRQRLAIYTFHTEAGAKAAWEVC